MYNLFGVINGDVIGASVQLTCAVHSHIDIRNVLTLSIMAMHLLDDLFFVQCLFARCV